MSLTWAPQRIVLNLISVEFTLDVNDTVEQFRNSESAGYLVLPDRLNCDRTSSISFSRIANLIGVAFLLTLLFCSTGNVFATREDALALLKEARAKSGKGLTSEAIDLYRRVAKLLPSNVVARKELARLLAGQRESRTEAEKVFAEATRLAPADTDLALERAANLVALEDNVNAALEYRRAFELTPTSEEALEGYVQQNKRLGSIPVAITRTAGQVTASPADYIARLILADLLYSDGRYEEATDHFSFLQRALPGNRLVLRGLAKSTLALGDYDLARELYQSESMHVSKGQMLADLASILIAEGRSENALLLLQSNPAEVEKDATAMLALADSFRETGNVALERSTLERLISHFPSTNISALERLARVSFQLKDKKTSLATCLTIEALDPQNSIAQLGLTLNEQPSKKPAGVASGNTNMRNAARDQAEGEAALFWDRPELAITSLQQALQARPESVRIVLTLGYALIKKGDTTQALAAFSQVALIHGRRPDALFGMADALMIGRNPQRALAAYEKVLEADPANFRALLGQASALFQTGKIERAAVILNELNKRSPESAVVRERLQEVLASIGRPFKLKQQLANATSENGSPAAARPTRITSEMVEPILRPGDTVEVTVVGKSNQSVLMHLDDTGLAFFPTITKPVLAGGLTERELASLVRSSVENPGPETTVTSSITEFRRTSLLVVGAVYLPGRFNIKTTFGLYEALMLAGGANKDAGRMVYVVRVGDPVSLPASDQALSGVEAYDRLEIEAGSVKPSKPLQTGDAVFVTHSNTAFIVGAVTRAGPVAVNSQRGLIDAIDLVGGLTSGASGEKIKLSRLMPNGTARQQFTINLRDIQQGKVGDVVLRADDIVEVTSTNSGGGNSFAKYLQGSSSLDATPFGGAPQVGAARKP